MALLDPLEQHRNALPHPDAHRAERIAPGSSTELIHGGGHQAGPARAQRVPERNRPPVRVHVPGIVDGAATILMGSAEWGKRAGLTPRARIRAMATAGAEPVIMLTAPAPATQKVLAQTGLRLEQIDVIELNEAFAAQGLAVLRLLGLQDDDARVNPTGGAIALGHPLGATGARLMTTLLDELERSGGRFGLQTMCEGGGQANVTIIERLG